MRDEGGDRLPRGLRECLGLAVLRCGQDQRPVLGANGMVGRDDAALADVGDVLAVDEIEDVVTGAEIEDQAGVGAFVMDVGQRADAAQDRRDLGQRRYCLR